MKKTMGWTELNRVLRRMKSEEDVMELYEKEKSGPARKLWLARILARNARLRRIREQKELV